LSFRTSPRTSPSPSPPPSPPPSPFSPKAMKAIASVVVLSFVIAVALADSCLQQPNSLASGSACSMNTNAYPGVFCNEFSLVLILILILILLLILVILIKNDKILEGNLNEDRFPRKFFFLSFLERSRKCSLLLFLGNHAV